MSTYVIHQDEILGSVALISLRDKPMQISPEASRKVRDHACDFRCGYGGSGAQLALAILLDHLGDAHRAAALHQRFKWQFIAPMRQRTEYISGRQIDEWLAEVEAETATEITEITEKEVTR